VTPAIASSSPTQLIQAHKEQIDRLGERPYA
jgi:hypothetical protein